MDTALLVFGVGAAGGQSTFCYAQLRPMPIDGGYGQVSVPKLTEVSGLDRMALSTPGLELSFWRRRLSAAEADRLRGGLEAGTIDLPADCPIESGPTLSGPVLPTTFLSERANRVPVLGGGALKSVGLVLDDAVPRVVGALQRVLGRDEVGGALRAVLQAIDDRVGFDGEFVRSRRLGVIEALSRTQSGETAHPLRLVVVKPDPRGDNPCRDLKLTREPGTAARDLEVVIRLRSVGQEVVHRRVRMAAADREVIVASPSHIVGAEAQVFAADTGDLLDHAQVRFFQGFSVSLSLAHGADALATPFRAAPESPDLTERARFSGAPPIAGIGFSRRAGGFDLLKRNGETIDHWAGPIEWMAESRFFPSGPDSQIEIIRWMKAKMEARDVAEAFLIDPYLGREAMERVIVRNGNESLKLTLIVSPGAVDPDGKRTDVAGAAADHVARLIAGADALGDRLCGDVEIVHIERGTGVRQAFHDRYLGLVGHDGAPTVFLLSNSLSKAAGDWPFVVAELDRATAWDITAYVRDLRAGKEGGKALAARTVWRSSAPEPSRGEQREPSPLEAALWAAHSELCAFSSGGDPGADRMRALVDPLLAALPEDGDIDRLGALIFERMHGRDRSAALLAEWVEAVPGHEALGRAVSAAQLAEVLDDLAPKDREPEMSFLHPDTLSRLGRQLARTPGGSDTVWKRLNPAVTRCLLSLEIGDAGDRHVAAFTTGLAIIVLGLETTVAATGLEARSRFGMATDYINLLGRLVRTDFARQLLAEPREHGPSPWVPMVERGLSVARELATMGGAGLETAWHRVATTVAPDSEGGSAD